MLWPLFQIQIAFQLPFVQRQGLWTGKRDREVSEVPKGSERSYNEALCVCEWREEKQKDSSKESETVLLVQ